MEKIKTSKEKFDEEMDRIYGYQSSISNEEDDDPKRMLEDVMKEQEEMVKEEEAIEKEELGTNLGDIGPNRPGYAECPEEEVKPDTQKTSKKPPTKTIEVTQQEHLLRKAQLQNFKALQNVQKIRNFNKTNKQTPEQVDFLKSILTLYESKKVTDPVLRHLVKKKVRHSRAYLEAEAKCKDLYKRMLTEISDVSDAIVKQRGIVEDVDEEIFAHVKEYPETLKGNEAKVL